MSELERIIHLEDERDAERRENRKLRAALAEAERERDEWSEAANNAMGSAYSERISHQHAVAALAAERGRTERATQTLLDACTRRDEMNRACWRCREIVASFSAPASSQAAPHEPTQGDG